MNGSRPELSGAARALTLSLAAGLILTGGCAPARAPAPRPETTTTRAVVGAPDHFVWAVQQGGVSVQPLPGATCLDPMSDPRDGTKLTLVRSRDGHGDYEVPNGRYDVQADELLRVECGTGQPIGIVKR